MIIVTPLLAIIETQVEELNLKISIKTVNLGNVSDEELETHVSQKVSFGDAPEVWIKNKKWLQIIKKQIRTRKKFIAADEPH